MGADSDAVKGRETPGAARLRQLLARSLADLKLTAEAERAEGHGDIAALARGASANVRRAVERLSEQTGRDEARRT